MTPIVIAIDGPAGSGKSSVSKQVARELKFGYLDTGAAYRALAWACLNLPEFNLSSLETKDLAKDFKYSISTDPDDFWVKLDSQDLTQAIRETAVAEYVSQVAGIPSVRDFMKDLTRSIISKTNLAGLVVEGRDITTVVAPTAQIRILLTASESVRLERRTAELPKGSVSSVRRQVLDRDASDSKVVDFMTPATGVQLVDTSDLNFNQSVSAVLTLIEKGLS
jgi:cytidylate kinase